MHVMISSYLSLSLSISLCCSLFSVTSLSFVVCVVCARARVCVVCVLCCAAFIISYILKVNRFVSNQLTVKTKPFDLWYVLVVSLNGGNLTSRQTKFMNKPYGLLPSLFWYPVVICKLKTKPDYQLNHQL